jgi:hypothetical protein
MDAAERTAFIDAWIRYQRMAASRDRELRLQAEETDGWARNRMYELTREQPDLAWESILEILDRNPDDLIRTMVTAGPFQDLVNLHSATFADRIETQARRSAEFRELLNGLVAIPNDLLQKIDHLIPKHSASGR